MPVAPLWRRVPSLRRIPDTLAGRLHRVVQPLTPCILFFSLSAVAWPLYCACPVADVRASSPIPTLHHITALLPQRQVPGKLAPRPARRSPADRNRDAAPKVITRNLLRRILVRGRGGAIGTPLYSLLRACWHQLRFAAVLRQLRSHRDAPLRPVNRWLLAAVHRMFLAV